MPKRDGPSFIEKMACKGELPINEMAGFAKAGGADKEALEEKSQESARKDTVALLLWTAANLFFIGLYSYFATHCASGKRATFLCLAGAFLLLEALCILKTVNSLKMRDRILAGEYEVRDVAIHHAMPGSGLGMATAVKVQDEGGKVYAYEFELSKGQKKAYKKDEKTVFKLIKMDGKKGEKYFLYLDEGEKNEKKGRR